MNTKKCSETGTYEDKWEKINQIGIRCLICGIVILLVLIIIRLTAERVQAENEKCTVAYLTVSDREDSVWGMPACFHKGSYNTVYEYVDTLGRVENRTLTMSKNTDGVYEMRDPMDAEHGAGTQQGTAEETGFRVMQLTDIHITGEESTFDTDLLSLQASYEMIERLQPDFIVVTGDVIYLTGARTLQDGLRALDVFTSFMDRVDIPWTWTFGNHDHEFFDQFTRQEVAQMLAQCRTLCIYPSQKGVSGYSNGVYLLCHPDDSLNMALITLDSNDQMIDSQTGQTCYDYVHEDEVQWYVTQINKLRDKYGADAKSMLYIHMPLQEYESAWKEANDPLAGQSEAGDQGTHATVLFGEAREPVCCSKHGSELFAQAEKLGSTVGINCGHDHLNDFCVVYHGINLLYGKSIDYIAYSGIKDKKEQRGAVLIVVKDHGKCEISSVRLEQ